MISFKYAPRRLTLPLVILIIVMLAVACGASGDSGDEEESGSAYDSDSARLSEPMPTTASGSAAGEGYDGDTSTGGAAAPQDGSSGSVPDLTAQPDWNRMVVRDAQLTLTVSDVAGGTNWVRDVAVGKGGYVFSSSSYVEDERQYSQVTIHVPAERFDETMNELRSAPFVEQVEREESSSQDVSSEFVDNESRLKALRETEVRFLELLGKAETVDEILRMEYELSNVRSQIETMQGRQNYLESVTSFSTISVSLIPSGGAVRPDRDTGSEFSFSHVFEQAWEHSRGAIQSVMIATLTVAIFAGALLPLALIAYVAYRIYRSRTNQRRTASEPVS